MSKACFVVPVATLFVCTLGLEAGDVVDTSTTATATISPQQSSGIVISPATPATLYAGQTITYIAITAPVGGTVAWTLTGPGTLSTTGCAAPAVSCPVTYTAPSPVASDTTATLTAAYNAPDGLTTASEMIDLLAASTVSITPASVTMRGSQSQQFTATTTDPAGGAVTYSLSSATCPAGTFGTITDGGLYTASATIVVPVCSVTVTAAFVAPDATRTATATILFSIGIVPVTPASVALYANGTQQFSATANDSQSATFTWSVSPNVGSISATGLYTAPATVAAPQTVTVTATTDDPILGWRAGAAIVTLIPPISVAVTPTSVDMFPGSTQQFTARVLNAIMNANVTWSVAGGGTISTTGLYTAPAAIPTGVTATVTATSVQDNTKSASVLVFLLGGPPVPYSQTNLVAEMYCGFLSRGSATAAFLAPPCANALVAIDSSGLAYWVGQITSGALTEAQVALSFYNSAEFQQSGTLAIDAYIGALNRDPDYAGFTYWQNQLKQGVTQLTMLNTFITSPEFFAIYGSTTDTQFVTLVYQNVLGRAPDTTGLFYWVGQLNAGVTRAVLLQAFVNGAESQALSNNRVLSIMGYMGFLRRTPDSQGRAFWTNELTLGVTPATLVTAFITSAEYINQFPGPTYPQ